MKLKKILASLTAAALAVTTMAIAPVSVSAAGFPYKLAAWSDYAEIGASEFGDIEDESKASVFLKYESIDTSDWGSQYKVMKNWTTLIFDSVNLPITADEKYAAIPIEYSKISDGMIVQGYNLKLTGSDVKYKVKSSGAVNESVGSWSNDVKIGSDMLDADVETIVVNYTCNGGDYSQIKIANDDYSTVYLDATNISNSNDTTAQTSCVFDLADYDGTGLTVQGHNITIKSIDSYVSSLGIAPPFEGEIIELPKNVWNESAGDDGWNWQGNHTVSQTQFTSGMSISDVLAKASTVKVSFKVNGATAGTDLDYDASQISWQIQVKCHKSDNTDWPWILGGTSAYENGIVTVTADISSFIENKYNNANYIFDSLQLIPAAANSSADDKIKVYYEDMKISVEKTISATKVTVSPTAMTLVEGDKDTITAAAEPANTTDTITFSSSDPDVAVVGAASGEVTAIAPGTAVITAKANDDVFAECTVTVKKAAQPITISVNDNTYGTASPDKTEAAADETVKISAEPADGYQFDNWVVVSGDVTLADAESASTTFTMPASEVEIKAVFSEIPAGSYAVVIKTAEGGSAKASEKTAIAGTEITLTATPDKGYEFDNWVVSPETVVIENDTFTIPEASVTVTPVFKKINYSIEVDVTAGGTASADKTTAQMGDTVTVTVVPDDGYKLDSITVNGTAISGTSFEMPAEDVLISVSFREEGYAEIDVESPDGISVGFTDDAEDVLAAIFGSEYASLIEAGYKLDVVMTVKDETAVSDDDKALIDTALSKEQHVGLILDITLIKTVNGTSEAVSEAKNPVSFSVSVPDSIIADGRTYSVVRIHDGKAENIGGSFNSETKAITVNSALFSTYAVVYEEKAVEPEPEPKPETKPAPVIYYYISTDKNVTASASTAAAGTVINVTTDFGYDACVYCGTRLIVKITDRGSFAMPSGNVRIVSQANGYLTMIKNAAPNSYIFVYDADMNYIKTNGSVKGIAGEGKVTVKLGEEYAGKTVTLYKGRKSTSVKLDSKTLDDNGNAAFTVEGGKNYTAVVE